MLYLSSAMRATVLRDALPAAAAAFVVGAVLFGASSSAVARSRGLALDTCDGCHGSAASAQLTVTPDRATFNPGDSVTFTVSITWPSIRAGGVAIISDRTGTLRALSGEGLALDTQQVMTHMQPKAAANGAVTFRFGWQAPATPGTASFNVAALAANGNGNASGDAPASGLFQWVFGCTGKTYFRDSDRDGYGTRDFGTWLACADAKPPEGYAAIDGDCNENDESVHPGAPEICNRKDDDCNGQVDENAPAVMMWPDLDGDGFYRYQTGEPKLGCGGVMGYAARGGDCDDTDPKTFPGAVEICNAQDDNCDGRADERVRPICGVGWCARYAQTCDPATCVPGDPMPEVCNSVDDDCDGDIDEDSCGPGLTCILNVCEPSGDAGVPVTPDAGPARDAATPMGGVDAGAPSSDGGAAPGGGSVDRGSPAGCSLGGRRSAVVRGAEVAAGGRDGAERLRGLAEAGALLGLVLGARRRRGPRR